jgi:glutathione peroxidase-family protein
MIKTKYIHFQNDIRNGMSLTDALQKHGLTLTETFNILHGQPRGHSPKAKRKLETHGTGEKYIQWNNGKYLLRKSNKYFGRYSTLEEAVFIRDYLVEHGWSKRNLRIVRSRL